MTSIIIVVVVMACAGWMAWNRWTYWRTPIRPQPSAEQSLQTRAFEAFAHGNRCPKRPYVAERLAEVARRQHAASPPAPVAAGG